MKLCIMRKKYSRGVVCKEFEGSKGLDKITQRRISNLILLPTLCTYLIKNYHNSHLKPHTLKMSVMSN